MAIPDYTPPVPARSSGLFERVVARLLMRRARVSAVTVLSENFRFIDLHGDELKGCAWAPGDKIQVKLDGGLITRTYTPTEWDKTLGMTRILACSHGAGPGSDWVRTVAQGDERQIMGPRNSLNLEDLAPHTVFFGDETSFGLAAAIHMNGATTSLRIVLEVAAAKESRSVLEAIGVAPFSVVERLANGSHLAVAAETIAHNAPEGSTVILTGNAMSIQYVSRALKAAGIASRRLRTKAYWAPGKEGLD